MGKNRHGKGLAMKGGSQPSHNTQLSHNTQPSQISQISQSSQPSQLSHNPLNK